MDELIERLKRRKLVQWALAYGAAAFALIQGLDIVAQRFGWPDALERFAIIALAVGFFVTLVLAWYHGERGAQKVSSTELMILALLLAIGGGFLWKFSGTARAPAVMAMPATTLTATAPSPVSSIAIPAKSIAVLPFENLSRDSDNAYFADGMQDMILTKLAGISDLKVISRTSTEKYKSRPDNLKTVAAELGVAAILEGSVQKSGNQVLINVQLIDANTDHHLWAEAYPRTLDNLFGVEGEVAQKIADALKAKLTSAESASVAKAPTRNSGAYDWFLKGEYQSQRAGLSWNEDASLAAAADYRQAIALDPDFALAYARLAYNELSRHWTIKSLSTAELASVKQAIDRALALAPDMPEAHVALGYYYYWGSRNYADATPEFQQALRTAPNNPAALSGLAFINRRTGQWVQGLDYLERALSVSPRDSQLVGEYGTTLMVLRRYTDADQQLKRALSIDPSEANSMDHLLITRLFGFGDVSGAREAFRSPPEWRLDSQNQFDGDVMYLINLRVYPDVFERRFEQALRGWDNAPSDTPDQRRIGQVARIAIKVIAGQSDAARPSCEKILPQAQAALARDPDSRNLLQQLGWVQVCLGRNAEAIQSAQRAVDLLPPGKDAYYAPRELAGLAEIQAHAGAPEAALKNIRQLLVMPAGGVMSIQRLKLDPVWDPLRKDPRFQKLIAEGESMSKAQASQ